MIMLFPAVDQMMQSPSSEANTLERERLTYQKTYRIGIFALSLLTILTLITLFLQVWGLGIAMGLVTLFALIANLLLLWRKRYFFREKFKQTLIPGVMSHLLQQSTSDSAGTDEYIWSYRPDGAIDEKRIRESRIFGDTIDEISGEDYIAGKLGAISFEFSELKLIRLDEDSERPVKNKVSLFNGVLFIADFPIELQGRTILQASRLFGIGNIFSRAYHAIANHFRDDGDKMMPIKLENHSFNGLYEVFSTNENEAKAIFSPELMERMVLAKRYHSLLAVISFVESRMHAAVKSNRGYLEPDFSKPIAQQMENVRDEIAFFLGLIPLMDLNNQSVKKDK